MKKDVRKKAVVVSMLSLLFIMTGIGFADTQVFTITDDANLAAAVAQVRADYLAKKPYITRLDVTLLLPNGDGTWRRGSYNPDVIAYPASCVKLGYLAAAMYWERINNQPYTYLDWCVSPMIVDSDNYATGDVVDAITGAPNYSTTTYDETFWTWYGKRLFTENYLGGRGLLENQTMMHKTYPTNSGSSPSGAEQLAIDYRGGNRMQPKCSASLMLEIIKEAIEPGANEYMRTLLTHDRWGMNSVLGFGLPPGCIYENKLGLAYDTLEDIAYVVLPNGQEFFVAAYSNAFVAPETSNPYPYDASALGVFCEMLYEYLGLDAGCPPKLKIDNEDPNVVISGTWSVGTDQVVDYDMYGSSYLYTDSSRTATHSVTWNLNVPQTGKYEVCVWSPQKSSGTTVTYKVNHTAGSTDVSVDQTVCGGRWVRLGDFDFNEGQGSVVLTNLSSKLRKTVMADAVKVTRWPDGLVPDIVVDNDDGSPAYTETGGWSTSASAGYDGGTYRFAAAGDPNTATWTADLPQAGDYKVFVWYRASSNRATSVKYDISTAAGTDTVFVNQTLHDSAWYSLGTFALNAGVNTITVDALGSSGGDVVIADAVGWYLTTGGVPTPTPTPTPEPTVTPTPTPTPTPSGKVFVNDISMSYGKAGVNYYALATVWIKNDSGADVEGATVYGTWSGSVNGTSSGVTGVDGKVTLQSPNKKNGGTFTITITDVVASGYTYDPSMNIETSDTISAP